MVFMIRIRTKLHHHKLLFHLLTNQKPLIMAYLGWMSLHPSKVVFWIVLTMRARKEAIQDGFLRSFHIPKN